MADSRDRERRLAPLSGHSMLQAFYSVRPERQLMERIEFDLLFRWIAGSGSSERFSVEGTSIQAYPSIKSRKPKQPPGN